MFKRIGFKLPCTLLLAAQACCSTLLAQTSSNASTNAAVSPRGMTLQQALQSVIDYNERLQIKLIETEISDKLAKAEKGIFEPSAVASATYTDSKRRNNTVQFYGLSLGSTNLFEQNANYSAGLEFFSPLGTRVTVGSTLSRLENNLQRNGRAEYETFVGTTVVQPLLKNFGTAATLSRLRLASLASDIAFQEYRRELLYLVGTAELAYWDLYLAQEQDRIAQESIEIARKVEQDNRARNEVGRAPELEVLQAQAGVATRTSRKNDARIRFLESRVKLVTLLAQETAGSEWLRAVDVPKVEETTPSFTDSASEALKMNPGYLILLKQAEQENIRVKFSQNQRLPQLDLKGSYGLNGLGTSPGGGFEEVSARMYPAWSVGMEVRVPLTGGVRERNELAAAKLAKQKALVGIKEGEQTILHLVDNSLQKTLTYRESVTNYQVVAEFQQKLLESQLARLHVGSIDSRTVLETEEKLAEAKLAAVESLVQYRKALVDIENISGTALRTHNLEITRAQLRNKTPQVVKLPDGRAAAPQPAQ